MTGKKDYRGKREKTGAGQGQVTESVKKVSNRTRRAIDDTQKDSNSRGFKGQHVEMRQCRG